jgi:hypothetical protein
MSVWLEKSRSRPAGGNKTFGRTTMRSAFEKFRWNSFLIWAGSGQCCPIVRTVALQLHTISISTLRAFGPREWSSGRLIRCMQFQYKYLGRPDYEGYWPDVWILNAQLALWMSASGWESTSSRRLHQSSYIYVLERNLIAGRTLSVIRTYCWNVRTDARWNSSKLLDIEEGLDGNFSSSRRMMHWTVGRSDGISRRLDGCKGSNFSGL